MAFSLRNFLNKFLGEPLGPRYEDDSGLILREFTNGLVVVNPPNEGHRYFSLPVDFLNWNGELLSSGSLVQVWDKKGMVLRRYNNTSTSTEQTSVPIGEELSGDTRANETGLLIGIIGGTIGLIIIISITAIFIVFIKKKNRKSQIVENPTSEVELEQTGSTYSELDSPNTDYKTIQSGPNGTSPMPSSKVKRAEFSWEIKPEELQMKELLGEGFNI